MHWLAPAGSGELDRQVPCPNNFKCLTDQGGDICSRAMTMDLDQIQMRKAIDQSGAGHFADTTKVIRIYLIDVSALELRRAIRHAVEHLIGAIQKMHRAQDKIQLVPMFFDPHAPGRGTDRIIIKLYSGANS